MPDKSLPDPHRTVNPASQQPTPPPADETTLNIGFAYTPLATSGLEQAAALTDAPEIPAFVISREIGKGGMGQVYAGRELALEREVAIKTLLPGANPERFVSEAKITARLPHPGIPPVHALGRLANGTPYLAMKLIRGHTLAELLEQRKTPQDDLPRFVQIFEQIAQAVGFAHSQGIIHRDLKPLNVMVGAFGEVQVMDWGLAKDLTRREQPTTGGSTRGGVDSTLVGAILGTPGYMSPEQARGQLVDARTDVFALGSILASVLTGKPAIVGKSADEILAKTAQQQLDDVLARLDQCGADAELIALARRCLAADAQHRPANGSEVAAAVTAQRASVEQRLREAETTRALSLQQLVEQTRRRKLWYGIAGALLLLVIASSSLAIVYARSNTIIADRETKTQNALALATQHEGEAKEAAALATKRELQAKEEAAISLAVNSFLHNDLLGLAGALEQAEAGVRVDPNLEVRELVLRAAQRIDGRFQDQPRVEAQIRTTIGNALRGVGEFKAALAQHRRVRELMDSLPNVEPLDRTIPLMNLGDSLVKSGETREALLLYQQAIPEIEARLGPDDIWTLRCQNRLAMAYQAAGRPEEGIALLQQIIDRQRKSLGGLHSDTLRSLNNLAGFLMHEDRLAEALPLLEEALQGRRKSLGIDHPETLGSMHNVAQAFHAAGRTSEAEALMEQVVRLRREKLGPDHPDTLASFSSLATFHSAQGNWNEALPIYQQALETRQAKLGPTHPETLSSMNNLAAAYDTSGRLTEAIALYEETLKLQQEKLGADHASTLLTMDNLAGAYLKAERVKEALPLSERAVKRLRESLGRDHLDTLAAEVTLAKIYIALGRTPEALPMLERILEVRTEQQGPKHPETLQAVSNLAVAYIELGRYAPAVPLLERSLQDEQEKLGREHPSTIQTMNTLGAAYLYTGRAKESLRLFEDSYDLAQAKLGVDHPQTLMYRINLAAIYQQVGSPKAVPYSEDLLKTMEEKFGATHSNTISAMTNLANAYGSTGKVAEAIALNEKALQLIETAQGPDHPDTRLSLHNLATAYLSAGRIADAIPVQERVVQLGKKQRGPNHPQTLHAALVLADTYQQLKRDDDAVKVFEPALQGLLTKFGTEHELTLQCLRGLAISEIRLKSYAEAELHLKEGFAAAQKLAPPDNDRYAATFAKLLIRLYEFWEKPDEASNWKDALELVQPK